MDLPLKELITLIPEYGRFDDLLMLLETKYRADVISYVRTRLEADIKGMNENESISLLAKWLPGVNASNAAARANARIFAAELGMTLAEYRKTLSKLRGYLDIVERKMSAKQFCEIKYEAVPSKANLIYSNAFLRNDEDRRRAYLEQTNSIYFQPRIFSRKSVSKAALNINFL
jgi:hypothetical protein